MQEIYILLYEQMVYAQGRTWLEEWDTQTLLGFWNINGSFNLSQKTWPYNNQKKKKRTYKIVDFVVPANNRVRLKESEKKAKYLDVAIVQSAGAFEYTDCFSADV